MSLQSSAHDDSTQWPGAFGVYKYSRNAIRLNLVPILGVGLVAIFFSVAVDAFRPDGDNSSVFLFTLFLQILSLVLSAITTIAMTDLELTGASGRKLSFKQSFRKVGAAWLGMIAVTLLTGLIALVSLLAFIIPFFIVFPRLLLAPYFLVDQDMTATDALKASWGQTKGHSPKVWGVIGVTILMFLLAFTIIGIPFSIYFLIMYSAAFAILYRFVRGKPIEPALSTKHIARPKGKLSRVK